MLICRVAIWGYALLCLAAAAIAVIGTQGLFGTTPDGLAAVWIILLGMPWSLFAVPPSLWGWPILIGQVIIIGAPILNLYILKSVCDRSRPLGE